MLETTGRVRRHSHSKPETRTRKKPGTTHTLGQFTQTDLSEQWHCDDAWMMQEGDAQCRGPRAIFDGPVFRFLGGWAGSDRAGRLSMSSVGGLVRWLGSSPAKTSHRF